MIELTQSMMLILYVLTRGAAWGYAIMIMIEAVTDGDYSISAGTLYRSLPILIANGLVRELSDSVPAGDARRRIYQITDEGSAALTFELQRIAKLIEIAKASGLLNEETQ